MACATDLQASTITAVKKSLLDLPSETIALVFENATDHDLAQLCRVSKAIRELAAAELYHNLNHTFTEDPVSAKLSIDYLAGFLETLATSDYNYAGHVKEVYVDTGYAAGKGEQTCRQFGYDLTCGKFLNTLLLATLKRTNSLEGFYWNARIELSTAVFLALHRMPNLRRVQIRLQTGQSLHSIPKITTGPNPANPSLNASPISPGVPPQGPHSPGAYGYPQPAQATNTFRMVPKIPVAKPVNQPCSFSGFKSLKSLCVLDMDTLEYIPELAQCIRNSLETLKQLELSLSDSLARRAREKPRLDGSDAATSDDASSVASQPLAPGGEGAPSGGNPEQMRQWHKARQEAILSKLLAPQSSDLHAKEVEAAVNDLVTRAESEAKNHLDRENRDPTKDAEDREFVKMMRAIFREVRLRQEPASNGGLNAIDTIDKIEKAATKYLEGRPKLLDEMKPKPKNKNLIKIKTPKPPPPNSWHIPHQTSSNFNKSYTVNEDILLDYFGFTKLTWDQMTSQTKNQYVQTYFKETQGAGFQSYPIPPPPPGKSSTGYNKVYYATPNSVPGFPAQSKYIVVPPKKVKKTPPAKLKYNSDSDEHGKLLKPAKVAGAESALAPEPLTKSASKEEGELGEDPEMIYPSDEEEEEGTDQEFETEYEASGDEEKPPNMELTELKLGINGVLRESGLLEENEEQENEESPIVVNKGKQAVRDPPNGHLTPPTPAIPEVAVVPKLEERKEEDSVSKYLRISHGLPIERLAIYLVPVKPAIFLQYFDAYALKHLTLLNVGSQRRIWASLTKLQRQSPLPLKGIFTDNVTPALLTFVESLEAGQLEDLFLLERYLRKKGRVPQLQDCDKTTVDVEAIRKQILKKHMKGFKRLVIRNDDSEFWAVNNSTMRLIAREGVNLRELAVQCDTISFHTIVRALPTLTALFAIQINFILDAGTPPISMTGVAVATQHHYGNNVIEPHTSASATMLHELRQCVIDSMTYCKATTQLEWIGFSWLTGGRHQNHLDGEGNPYVFLSKVVKEVEVETEDEDDETVPAEKWSKDAKEDGSAKGKEGEEGEEGAVDGEASAAVTHGSDHVDSKTKPKPEPTPIKELPISFWAENDLNISEVQGVKMWEKEVWAGRL